MASGMSESIFGRLAEIANEQNGTPTETFKLSARWKEDLGFDSMDIAEMAVAIEEEWDIDFKDHPFLTVEDTVEVIEAKTGKQ